MEIKYQFIPTNGIRLHSALAGSADRPAVVLLHGFPGHSHMWNHHIPLLANAGFQVIAPDQRGYNLSDKPAGVASYRLDKLAADIIGLLDSLDIRRASIVGHDWGGAVAWALAALYPERVEKLAVMNAPYPPVVYRSLWRNPKQLLRSTYIYFFQFPLVPEAILRNNNWELLVNSMKRSCLPGTFHPKDFAVYQKAWWRKNAMTSMLNWYRALMRQPVNLPVNNRFEMPVSILWGAKDPFLSRALASECLTMCPRGELIYYEHNTHWLVNEEPTDISQRLIEFIQRQ